MSTPSYPNSAFGYRTAGVVTHKNKVLLHRSETDAFWSLPGGKVKLFETSQEALVRGFREEAGVAGLQIIRLLWIVENFFKDQGNVVQELGFYYLCRFPSDSRQIEVDEFPGIELSIPGKLNLFFRWFERTEEDLRQIPILPVFLQSALIQLPEHISHIVNIEY